MEKNFYYTVNVHGKRGYSFMVESEDELFDEGDVIDACLDNGLFECDEDADCAFVDDLVSAYDIEHFKKNNCCHKI